MSPSSLGRSFIAEGRLWVHTGLPENVKGSPDSSETELIQAQKLYELQLYPRNTHSIAGPDVRTHLYNRILAQFETYLMPPVQ